MQQELSTYSDAELFALLIPGNKYREKAFDELYTRHSSRVYLYCRRILGDESLANDIFQEAFLQFLKTADEKRTMTNVPAFLLRIARNLCLNARRARRYTMLSIEDFQLPVHDSPYEKEELARLMATALDLLPDDYREALVLQAYNGLSYAEIAETLDVPLTTVRNRVVRAKAKLQKILAPYLEDLKQ